MTTQIYLDPAPTRQRECRDRNVALPKLVFIAGLHLDLLARPIGPKNGHKQAASVEVRIGGAGANGGLVGIVNGIPTGVIAVQAGGAPGAWCDDLASQRGLVWIPVARTGAAPALTLAVPNGTPGEFDLHIQRILPPSVVEMDGIPDAALQTASAVIVGPMPDIADTEALHAHVVTLSQYAAMIVHPSLLSRPTAFVEIASRYRYFQMNASEAAILDSSADHVAKLACKVRHLLTKAEADDTDFAITNGGERGYVWADGHWFPIDPPKIVVRSNVGAGDAFCTAWVIARRFFNASAKMALDYARRIAAAYVSGQNPPPF